MNRVEEQVAAIMRSHQEAQLRSEEAVQRATRCAQEAEEQVRRLTAQVQLWNAPLVPKLKIPVEYCRRREG